MCVEIKLLFWQWKKKLLICCTWALLCTFFFLWLPHDVVTKMKRQRNNEKFISTAIHYYQKVSRLIIWLFNWSSSFKKLKRTKQIEFTAFFYLAQRPPQNVFRFPSPRPLWWWVGQSGKTKTKTKTKKNKKKRKERMNTWRGLGSREDRAAK